MSSSSDDLETTQRCGHVDSRYGMLVGFDSTVVRHIQILYSSARSREQPLTVEVSTTTETIRRTEIRPQNIPINAEVKQAGT